MKEETEILTPRNGGNLPYVVQEAQRRRDEEKYLSSYPQEKINLANEILARMEATYNARAYHMNIRKNFIVVKAEKVISSNAELSRDLQAFAAKHGCKRRYHQSDSSFSFRIKH